MSVPFQARNSFFFFRNVLVFEWLDGCALARGTKRPVSVNICLVEGNSADIFVTKVSPGIFVIKVK